MHGEKKCFDCDVCKKTFTKFASLVLHKRSHTDSQPYECDVCKRKFKFSTNLRKHKKAHPRDDKSSHECDDCDKTFDKSEDLAEHQRMHKPYECDFARSSEVKSHKKIHDLNKPYECGVCKKRFFKPITLERHKKRHNARPQIYECDVCKRKFAYEGNLMQHKMTHLKDVPILCKICGKEICKSQDMKKAKMLKLIPLKAKTHGPDASYQCNTCQEIQSAGTGYVCSFCGCGFDALSELQDHMVIHNAKSD
ncbi:zinc finger 271-like [Paramuricea clavata]|uniref:Zinc finger 271-like n=1 Tax=Paramuricea clavata TaxID=317549 RepID=A0A7D9EPC4_PARCT|nr:zinc finger 271-like [Paramuricea clavata]